MLLFITYFNVQSESQVAILDYKFQILDDNSTKKNY